MVRAAMIALCTTTVASATPADAPARPVAALYYPGSQLLVLAATAHDPTLLDTRLFYKQYRDIYVDLQGRSVPASSLFIQDMKADGLPDTASDTPDVVYRPDGKTVVFDGDSQRRGVAEED